MKAIFLDLRSEEEFASDHEKRSINIPLADILFDNLKKLRHVKLNTSIEYYYPLGNFEDLLIKVLNQNGYFNLYNRANVTYKPLIHEYKITSKIQSMERKEERNTRAIFC